MLIAFLKVIPLTAVKGIGEVTAAKLEASGITTAQILVKSSREELVAQGFSETRILRWQQNAKKLLEG